MLLTYHCDPDVKAARIARCKAHIEADRLRAQTYGEENGRFIACAIGCQLYDIAAERGVDWRDINNDEINRHRIVADDYGWPDWLCWLEDTLFEGLPESRCAGWPLELVEAVPVGVDIEPVRHRLMAFIQREMLLQYLDAEKFPAVASAIERTAVLYEQATIGGPSSGEDWAVWLAAAQSAEAAAELASAASAARSAAWSAAEAARSAASAARAVQSAEAMAQSVEAAARSAAWSVESARSMEAAAWSMESVRSAGAGAYEVIAHKLLSLLATCGSQGE